MKRHLVWFRNDLRTDDNPALHFACKNTNEPVLAVYLYSREQWLEHNLGANQQALVSRALEQLKDSLAKLNIPLMVLDASLFKDAPSVLSKLVEENSVTHLHFNVEYSYNERERDKQVANRLENSVSIERYVADSLVAPWQVATGSGGPYKVFTPFSKAARKRLEEKPLEIYSAPKKRAKDNLDEFTLSASIPVPNVKPTAKVMPEIREASLAKQLECFIEERVAEYNEQRNFPAIQGTSELSSALAIGCLSVRRCYEVASKRSSKGAFTWVNELLWRDFYRAVMWHFPKVGRGQSFLGVDRHIRWEQSEDVFTAWKNGKTGVPIIDAAMRQLVETGWMHNRLRMVVANFLSKNLWLDWRKGEAFFAQNLYDFDFPSNNGGWQWSASVGTDAAPYFRVFNPQAQGQKFDPKATFIKQWLPELRNFSASEIHRFDKQALSGYTKLMVELKQSRKAAIEAFKVAKEHDGQ